ncbi:sensor histidine kinase [Naasia sp. SYSU D00948]|uniref:sensor histidine kinase n=1 Tax=Naasia sp. SYSU D00948 TaxID=2817379 RepID=UPI001B3041C5|nr:histidine kinase [Naasia sp. SYSU D00948]
MTSPRAAVPPRWQAGDRWLPGLLVTLGMVLAVVLVDLLLMGLWGAQLGERNAAILAAIAVTLVVAPLHDRLSRGVRRLLTGRRDTFEVVSRLAARMERAADAKGRLDDLVAVVAECFSASYVEVRLEGRLRTAEVAHTGTPSGEPQRFPLEYRGETLGHLLLAGARRLSARDRAVLADLVRLAAAAIVTAETSDELQRIRTRLVVAREDERARLHGDLHDNLVPLLEGLRTRSAAARDGVRRRDPAARDDIAAAVSAASSAVDDIRRVAQDLRPPALDDLGLARALDQLADRYRARIPQLTLHADLPGSRPPAIEVAVYRIVADALETVSRRGPAGPVSVRVEADGGVLRVTAHAAGVADLEGGRGRADVDAQRERAEELGGTWTVSEDGQGAAISAVLPVDEEVARGA